MAAAGIRRAVLDARARGGVRVGGRRLSPRVRILDDGGSRAGVRRALDEAVGAHLILGPYGSDLAAEAAAWAAERERVLWNHGGSADEVQRLPGVVSVPSPTTRYGEAVVEAVAEAFPGARVILATRGGRFGGGVADGAREAARRLGLTVLETTVREIPEFPEAEVLLTAGSFAEDVEAIGRLRRRPRALAAAAAGVGLFGDALGPLAEGVRGPSQWEEGVRFPLDTGPRAADVVRSLRAEVLGALRLGPGGVDYPAAQAYATVLVALRCAEEAGALDDASLLTAARALRCTTFFGRFELGEDGRQQAHEMLVVQWRRGVKRVVWPPHLAEAAVGATR